MAEVTGSVVKVIFGGGDLGHPKKDVKGHPDEKMVGRVV